MPSIIADLGYTATHAQLLSAPPFVCGCISTISVGIYSDKVKLRGPMVASGLFVSLIGFIVLYTQPTPGVGYAGTMIACLGLYSTVGVGIAWASGNSGGHVKRGIVIAMVIGIANLGGYVPLIYENDNSTDTDSRIFSSFIYFDPPHYHHGHGAVMGWLGLGLATISNLYILH